MAMSPSHIPPSHIPPPRPGEKTVTIFNPTVASKDSPTHERCSKCGRRYRQTKKKVLSSKSIGESSMVDASKSQGSGASGEQELVEQIVLTRTSNKSKSKKSKKHSHRSSRVKSTRDKSKKSKKSTFSQRMQRKGLRKVVLTLYRGKNGKFVRVPRPELT